MKRAYGSSVRGLLIAGLLTNVAVVVAGPNVEITKSCPSLRYLGRNATFDITVTNSGDAAAQNVVVTDTISGAIQFVSADNQGTRQGNNIVWHLGTLEAGQSRVLKANFMCNQIGIVANTAEVTYCAASVATCQLEVKGIQAILLECVDDPDPVELGTNTTYTISVTNQGSATGTNIVIACTLPAEQEHVSATGPTDATVSGKSVKFAPIPTLAPKAKATFKLTVKGVGVGDTRFRVDMTSDLSSIPVMETESTHIYE
jgi:uncharacterized repeat protein (TIGR01451 family)